MDWTSFCQVLHVHRRPHGYLWSDSCLSGLKMLICHQQPFSLFWPLTSTRQFHPNGCHSLVISSCLDILCNMMSVIWVIWFARFCWPNCGTCPHVHVGLQYFSHSNKHLRELTCGVFDADQTVSPVFSISPSFFYYHTAHSSHLNPFALTNVGLAGVK